jgi:hypothetical protein
LVEHGALAGGIVASYNWKDHAVDDLWDRYAEAPLSRDAQVALERARSLGADYVGRARALAREFERPEPDALEFMLDLLLHARVDTDASPFAEIFGRNPAFDGLIALRRGANWGGSADAPQTAVACPRVFVSHRQVDYPHALRIARLAADEGFQFWLDVLDPTLTWLNTAGPGRFTLRQEQLLIAVAIEMALLHCTHVIAVMTPSVYGSGWVPYEYGRVKDSSPFSLQAGCWVHPQLGSAPWEYLLLGVSTRTEDDIQRWLRRELGAWNARFKARCGRNDWREEWGEPGRLPGS